MGIPLVKNANDLDVKEESQLKLKEISKKNNILKVILTLLFLFKQFDNGFSWSGYSFSIC